MINSNIIHDFWDKYWDEITNDNEIIELWWWKCDKIHSNPFYRWAEFLRVKNYDFDLSYTWPAWTPETRIMLAHMLCDKIWDDVFFSENIMTETANWCTSLIRLLSWLFFRENIKILNCGYSYYEQLIHKNEIENVFHKKFMKGDYKPWFRILPTAIELDKKIKWWEVIWIIQPWFLWECYSKKEAKEILSLIKEKNCSLVIDSVFEWTEFKWENVANFYKLVKEYDLFEKTIFIGSPSKWEWFSWWRIAFLWTKNKEYMKYLKSKKSWWEVKTELIAVFAFCGILNNYIKKSLGSPNWTIDNINKIPTQKIIDKILIKHKGIFNCISSEESFLDIVRDYILWKKNYYEMLEISLKELKKYIWKWKIFIWMNWEVKNSFNHALILNNDIVKKLKKHDISEVMRLLAFEHNLLITPLSWLRWNDDICNDLSLIRYTTAVNYKLIAKTLKETEKIFNSL